METTAFEIPSRDLPLWMRRARRGVDWGMLIVIAFSLAIGWSFIIYPDLPHTNMTENYVYSAANYAEALAEGHLYPRWSPYVFGGYGAPIPNYYPPGAPYSAALLQVLFTNDTISAVRLVYVLALCLAGSMLYVFVTRWVGAGAGVLASALYVYSPFVGMVAPHVLGDLPVVMALALLPALLWSITRLVQLNSVFDLLGTALLVAALIVTEPRFVPVGLLLLAGLLGWCRWHKRYVLPWRQLLLVCFLGLTLAAFYWMPALLEQGAISWRAAHVVPSYQLTWPELVQPVQQLDRAALIAPPQLTLGWLLPLFVLFSTMLIFLLRDGMGFYFIFLVMGLGLAVFALTIMPQEVWLLGPITLCLAIGGSALYQLPDLLPAKKLSVIRKRLRRGAQPALGLRRDLLLVLAWGIRPHVWRRVWLPVLLVTILVVALPIWLSPESTSAFGETGVSAQILYEQRGFGVPVLPASAPIPATISQDVSPSRYLINGYTTGNVNRIAPDQISVDTQVSVLAHTTQSDHYQIRTNRLVTLNVLTAYFPGWEAVVDERQVTLYRNAATQLMSVIIPITSGGELTIRLGSTPLRDNAWTISFITLLLLLGFTWPRLRHAQNYYDDVDLLSPQESRLVGVVAVCFIVFLGLLTLPDLPLQLRARPGYALDNSFALQNRTDRGLEALAYRIDALTYRPGETLDLTIYWRSVRPLTTNYKVQVSLRDATGSLTWNRTTLHDPGNYPTQRWPRNQYVVDAYHIQLADTIVPGEYRIAVEVFACDPECSPDKRITFFDQTGNLAGPVLFLPVSITINPR